MKYLNSFLLAIIILFLISNSSCNYQCIDAEGPTITELRTMKSFDGINIEIPADVKLTIGHDPSISITAPKSYVKAITTSITRNKLLILGDVCKAENHDIIIEIVSPELESIKIVGGASVYSDSPIKSDDITLKVDGSGSISMSVFTNDIDGRINGSGDIILNGTCKYIDFDVNGSGRLKGLGLNAFKAKMKITGSGKASVDVHNKLHATVVGSGEINYSGNPEISINISGSGEVNKIN